MSREGHDVQFSDVIDNVIDERAPMGFSIEGEVSDVTVIAYFPSPGIVIPVIEIPFGRSFASPPMVLMLVEKNYSGVWYAARSTVSRATAGPGGTTVYSHWDAAYADVFVDKIVLRFGTPPTNQTFEYYNVKWKVIS